MIMMMMMIMIIIIIIIIITKLSSLADFPAHILSASFASSVQAHKSLIYTSSFSSSIPSYW
jgi:hypothetical protein